MHEFSIRRQTWEREIAALRPSGEVQSARFELGVRPARVATNSGSEPMICRVSNRSAYPRHAGQRDMRRSKKSVETSDGESRGSSPVRAMISHEGGFVVIGWFDGSLGRSAAMPQRCGRVGSLGLGIECPVRLDPVPAESSMMDASWRRLLRHRCALSQPPVVIE